MNKETEVQKKQGLSVCSTGLRACRVQGSKGWGLRSSIRHMGVCLHRLGFVVWKCRTWSFGVQDFRAFDMGLGGQTLQPKAPDPKDWRFGSYGA